MGRLGRQDNDLFGERPASLPSGILLMHAGSSPPSGWLLCDGSAVSRSDYANLFAVVGVSYGAGNGTTTFNLPDLRARFPVGKAASGTFASLGTTGGAESVTLTGAQSGVAAHSHSASGAASSAGDHSHGGATSNAGGHSHSGSTSSPSPATHAHGYSTPTFTYSGRGTGNQNTVVSVASTGTTTNTEGNHTHTFNTSSVGDHGHTFSTSSGGGHGHAVTVSVSNATTANAAQAHDNLPPYVVVNYIIKT